MTSTFSNWVLTTTIDVSVDVLCNGVTLSPYWFPPFVTAKFGNESFNCSEILIVWFSVFALVTHQFLPKLGNSFLVHRLFFCYRVQNENWIFSLKIFIINISWLFSKCQIFFIFSKILYLRTLRVKTCKFVKNRKWKNHLITNVPYIRSMMGSLKAAKYTLKKQDWK